MTHITYEKSKNYRTNPGAYKSFPRFLRTQFNQGCFTPEESTDVRKDIIADY